MQINDVHKNANPTAGDAVNAKIGATHNIVKDANEEYPKLSATTNHSIPANTNINGLTAINIPNTHDTPLPPWNPNHIG
jgi:hypothetical protein